MSDNTNDENLDPLNFSLDDSDLDALKNLNAVKKESENTGNIDVSNMEISWEDSLEALRQERAKLNQQVLQHETVEAVPLMFEQAVQEVIQEKSNEEIVKPKVIEESLPESEEIEIIHDELSGSFLDEIGLVGDEDYDSILGTNTILTDSVSFKSPPASTLEQTEGQEDVLGLSDDLSELKSEPIHFSMDSDSDEELNLDFDVDESQPSELKMVFDDEEEPVQETVQTEKSPVEMVEEVPAELSEFEKIKQEALARAQQNASTATAKKELIKMVNPAINFNNKKAESAEPEKPAIDSEKKLGVGSFSAAQIAAATNMVKPQIPVVDTEVKAEPLKVEQPQDEIEIEPIQAATLRRAYEQDEKPVIKEAPVKSIMVPEKEKKESIPELNLAVPEKSVVYDDVAAEVITQEPVSLVGETQLLAAIIADLQPQLEKIISDYVRDEVMKQTASLVKNIGTNLEKELPNLLSETLSVQIKKTVQRVKNPLKS